VHCQIQLDLITSSSMPNWIILMSFLGSIPSQSAMGHPPAQVPHVRQLSSLLAGATNSLKALFLSLANTNPSAIFSFPP
jgi:Flp pilus assembly protein protease CpaA